MKTVPDAARFGVAEVDESCGQVLNFGEKPDFKRVIFTNDRKELLEHGLHG